ncbi:subclass B3 metallo-beta-lactamase [Altererythrobacter sp. MF3-039]|uniref:subclass B3 metallo-beta-lactamase n=1 Tax=Altererythrobacter sp. MF3-039 TaxID=3252901 RepID=UPI00390C99D3
MFARITAALASILVASCATAPVGDAPLPGPKDPQAFLETCEDWDDWAKPAPPFQILGNSWYVGTCGISAVLITGEQGHILIDSGVENAAAHVLANIRELGFEPEDVQYLLMSHEHFDHIGGHAAITEATGAQVVASAAAASVLRSGVVDKADPQALSNHPDMAPVSVSKIMGDGDLIELGPIKIMAHTTPGHTPGAISWTWNACNLAGEPPICRRIAYVDSLSPVSSDAYRFSDHPEYLAHFRASIAKVRDLPCDLLVTPHPSSGKMIAKMRDGTFGLPSACEEYAEALGAALDRRLVKERNGG